jgi:hypothetical protein
MTQDKSMLENTEGILKKHIQEKLATLGTHDTGQIHVREYRRGNEERQSKETGNITEGVIKRTIQRNCNIGYTRHRTNKC